MVNFERVFLITIDCLRADHVGCISGVHLTPNIDKIAKDAFVFTRAFSNGPGTNQSFPAILTSTYFLIHGDLRLNPGCTTLAEVLSNHGFKTVAFHSNPFLSKILGWDKGFSEFYDFMNVIKSPSAFVAKQQKLGLTGKVMRFIASILGASNNAKIQIFLKKFYYKLSKLEIPYVEGEKLNKYVINWLERNKNEKIFMWIHYMDPHEPYVPPEEYLMDFSSREEAFNYNLSVDTYNPSEEEISVLKRLYEGEVKYTDNCIGEFLNHLEERKLLDNSLLIITADHGHAFMEHGRYAHAYDILYNEVIHIPLIIYGIGKKKVESHVQLLDLSPTILDLLGIKQPATFIGKSMFKREVNTWAIFSESARPDLINLKYDISRKVISCIRGEYKLIVNELRNTIELYNIERDFQERNNLFHVEEEKVKELTSLINKHLLDIKLYKMKIRLRNSKTCQLM